MSTKTLESLCDKLPTELAIRILKIGAGEMGSNFGAKCMRLAAWVQPIIAPILYRVVTIHNSKEARSLFLAIARNISGKGYSPRALIDSLVFHDDTEAQARDPIYATVIAEIVIALNNANYKRLKIPLHLMESPLRISRSPLFPPSVTFGDAKGSLFPDYTYAAVTKLRLVDFSPTLWEVHGLLSVANRVTHLSLTLTSDAWGAVSVIERVSRLSQIQLVVAIVKMPPDAQDLKQLLNLKTEPPTWVAGIILSKVVVWEWNSEVQDLLDDENDEALWTAAEKALML